MSLPRTAIASSLMLAVLAGPAPAQTGAGHGLTLGYRDTTCAPCRDFFQYANGAWLARTTVPEAYSAYGADQEIEDRSQVALHDLLEDAARKVTSAPEGSNARRLGLFYGSCMDSARAEAEGAKPLASALGRIAAIAALPQLSAEVADLHDGAISALFLFYSRQDPGNSSQYIIWAYPGGIGLPDRDYYTRTDSASVAMRAAYVDHIGRTFALLGDADPAARAAADRVMAIETALARASMTAVERRDPRATYHKLPLSSLEALAPSFAWKDYLARRGLPRIDSLNVAQPGFFRAVDSLLRVVPLSDWRAYLRWKTADDASPRLSSAFVNEDFRFRQRLTGAKILLPRWKRCIAATDQALGEALGEVYVQRFFPPEAKARALAMVENLERTLESRLGRLGWMSDTTRREAIAKLRAFQNKVGYPDRWRDYTAMTLGPVSYYENAVAAARFDVHRRLARLGRPIDRTEWMMSPPTVNAYYNAGMNEIVFPAGILQAPYFFFDPAADDAVNYGATGAAIGHEMTHGFDDEGRKFDSKGNLRDWWTPADERRYKARAQKVVDQFSHFVAVDTLHVNGKLTLGENIADLGGLVIAYEAFERSLAGKPRTPLDGFTPEQRFFIAYAQSWREKHREAALRNMVATDGHAPEQYRAATVRNLDAWYAAFPVTPNQKMYLAPKNRVRIW